MAEPQRPKGKSSCLKVLVPPGRIQWHKSIAGFFSAIKNLYPANTYLTALESVTDLFHTPKGV